MSALKLFRDRGSERDPELEFSTLRGRLSELSGDGPSAVSTAAVRLIVSAQRLGEPCAWLTGLGSTPFAEDLVANGVDLQALAVCCLDMDKHPSAIARAADQLLRSGAFGLVICDLAAAQSDRVPTPLFVRLAGLVRKHEAACVFLTEKSTERPSLGSLIALRVHVARERKNRRRVTVTNVKDKRRAPGWRAEWGTSAPAGMQ